MLKPGLVLRVALVISLTAVSVSQVVIVYPASSSGMNGEHMGPAHMKSQMAWFGYYDGHKDTYLNTDVSDKGQAASMHINYAPVLAKMPMSATPAIYLVEGKAAANQLTVFGSEPGESDYSPIWREVIVIWKSGAKPVLLVRDDQILSLAKAGKLTVRHTSVALNCPIVTVGK